MDKEADPQKPPQSSEPLRALPPTHTGPGLILDEDGMKRYWDDAQKRLIGSGASSFTEAATLKRESERSTLNIGYLCTDRQISNLRGSAVALRFQDLSGNMEILSYGGLTVRSNSFANILGQIGVMRKDTLFTLLGRIPELYTACLGTLKYEAIFCPLFAAFGPDPIKTRMNLGAAKVLLTTGDLYEKKFGCSFSDLPRAIPSLKHVIIIGTEKLRPERSGLFKSAFSRQIDSGFDLTLWVHDYDFLMRDSPTLFDPPSTSGDTPALIHFTSGTTGTPKGAVHVHEAVICHFDTAHSALGLRDNDIFWCTADPGWVTGTSYGIFAPLTVGATVIVTEGEFDPLFLYQTLEDQKVSVWYTAPTALRMLMKAGDDLAKAYDLSALRIVASVGEPLNAEVVHWGRRVLGKEIHDTWCQTETGCIMIANRPYEPVKPGFMGRPLPGIEAAVVKPHDLAAKDKALIFVSAPEEEGELALKTGWPSLFRGYLGNPIRYQETFLQGWYLTGDLVKRDHDGYFCFVGRRDDVIKSSGHLIGPFEIESVLMEHDGISEAGVIGTPDAILGEVVKAFLSLKKGYTPSDTLRRSVLAHARQRLGPAVAPQEIAFVDSLPKTHSGKVMRRLLKARELGLPEGDTSTLEGM